MPGTPTGRGRWSSVWWEPQLPEGGPALSSDLGRGEEEAWWREGGGARGGTASEKALNQDSAWCVEEGGWGGGSVENREWTRGAGAPGPPE